ncbi:tail fiber protein [Thalassospira lohafexi]|uniref:Phage tail collar domain-containing protein n=1 Tax=Thalassospira lohafexi TaxID=744227 RepID=A0A2N3L6H8_9PROT|nr:tail fiber protein [Thalassospira lohafexi]PKR58408.1 hypothetical protein COO92_11770 [Thalassospira lohafexi]
MQGSTPVDCEVLNVIQGAGIWPDCEDKTQLLQAINTLISGGGSGGGNTVIIGSEIGTVSAFAMPTAPEGWLVCDGSAVSRTDYADLFATIGTLWGDGDQVSTFTLPDLRGEFVRGFDNGRGVDEGRVFASSQTDEFKSHDHTLVDPIVYINVGGGSDPSVWNVDVPNTTKSRTTEVSGGLETRPRNVAMTYAIKAFYPTAPSGQ